MIAYGLIFALTACASVETEDPILGCWQREEEDVALVFEEHGAGRLIARDGGVVDYVFPKISWRRDGPQYRIAYDWPRRYRRENSNVYGRVNDGSLYLGDLPTPYEKVSMVHCGEVLAPNDASRTPS